jgi:multiple sugar transport system ATP-binding protein
MRVGGKELFFRVGKDLRHDWGEDVSLVLDMNRLHAFDPETGESLLL